MKFYVELELEASRPVEEASFDALADALHDLDAGDPQLSDADLSASLTAGTVTVSMIVEAADPAAGGTKALSVTRSAAHATGAGTPGWETAHSILRVAPADLSGRLVPSA